VKLAVQPGVIIATREVVAALKRPDVQILDVRTVREFKAEDIRAIRGGRQYAAPRRRLRRQALDRYRRCALAPGATRAHDQYMKMSIDRIVDDDVSQQWVADPRATPSMWTSDGSGALRRAGLQPAAALAVLLALAACTPAPTPALPAAAQGEWREFQGTWTAAGSRHVIRLGPDRQASVADLSGSLLLAGPSRPGVGFRAEAVVLNDSATGMVGRSVWTDERGDQVFSELRGEGTATGNRITGSIVGGTGRYAGATGTYEFSWRFVLETEDGTVQGQSVALKGRVRAGAATAAARP